MTKIFKLDKMTTNANKTKRKVSWIEAAHCVDKTRKISTRTMLTTSGKSIHLLAFSLVLVSVCSADQLGPEVDLARTSNSRLEGADLLMAAAANPPETPFAPGELDELNGNQNDLAQLSQPFDYHASMPVITKRELAAAIKLASSQVKKLRESLEPHSGRMSTPDQLLSTMFHRLAIEEPLINQTNQALLSEETTRILAKQHKLNRLQTLRGLPLISVDQTSLGMQCQRTSRASNCIAGKYRSLSGHCNNVQSPDWGAARTPLVRYAPARYADHISRPVRISRQQRAGPTALPSARSVSLALHSEMLSSNQSFKAATSTHMTTLLSFFGQMISHDLAHVGQFAAASASGQPIACCAKLKSSAHPECLPVELVEEDFCLNYVRSTPATRQGCNLGPRDQLNLVSSYLDGSTIYGSSEEQVRQLRTFAGGKLKSQRVSVAGASGSVTVSELLPDLRLANSSLGLAWEAAAETCRQVIRVKSSRANRADQAASRVSQCFLAGDERANENIGLTVMHTIWMREHNQIADKLSQLNRHWDDERLFQEARKILIAQLQHITYAEFLPSILGDEVMQQYNLTLLTDGFSQTYDPQLNAGTSNELAVAVLPFILSTIPGELERYSDRLEMLGTTSLADTFMDGSELFRVNKIGQFLMGMISQSAMEPAHGLMPMLLADQPLLAPHRHTRQTAEPEVDLVALTIQQARDHGLKSYLYWRRACQLKPQVRTWLDLEQVMPASLVERLRQVYNSPDQLDLYLGLLESPQPGSSVGPTFVCLLARQFFHLKHGDRYWYENDLPGSGFSLAQLDQIRQTSLAKVLCRNSQSSISFVQPQPMITSDPYLNAYQYCSNKMMSKLDLSKWRESVTSAADLKLDQDLAGNGLLRARRLVESSAKLVARSLRRARRQLDELAYEDTRRARRASSPARSHAGYRYLARVKRETLKLTNQSLIFELATNEVVRSLVHKGKDREDMQSIQADIREFLLSLESVQLENLLENSAEASRLADFISGAGGSFLSVEQRNRLAQLGDPTLSADPAPEFVGSASRDSSVSANCQDDDRAQPCDHTSPYRTITGWCNNLARPKFGQSFTTHDRILPSAYDDGLARPRSSSVRTDKGQRVALPSARLISSTMHDDKSKLHSRYSLAVMQFGQFGVDHDLTRTPFSVSLDGSLLDCSSCDSKHSVHRDCLPIEIPANDAHFHSARAQERLGAGKRCLHFVRSLNGQTGLGPRQQINALTSYLDGSNIYGSDNCEAKSLRAFQGGRLNSSTYLGPQQQVLREIMPVTRANPECVTPAGVCFHAGDQRASEQPGLTSIHTLFMRLHNSIANQLGQLNKHWNDEKLYQQARRIVGAIMQRITFNEFAPRLLGLDYMSRFDLNLKNVGYSDSYNDQCSASVLNEFSAAAFRMGHSLIRNAFPLLNRQYKPIGKAFQLRKAFFNSQRILTEPSLIDSILRGLVSTPIETLDNAITEEITNHLFEKPGEPFSGMDLISLNIQRARDHGLAGYNKYRAKCNLTLAKTFDDLAPEIPGQLIKRLSSIYAHVDDIDLFPGGVSELPVHGGLVGPTFACIIGMQFSRLRHCDRFWHETSDPWVRFSSAQLAEIRKVTLAKVICQESDQIDTIQRNAMDVPDQNLNPRVSCSSLPSMDFSVWRENQKSCLVGKIKLELGQSKRVSPCKSCTCTLEGPVCRTAKINCIRAIKQSGSSGLSQLMADKLCLVQCAWALDVQPSLITG